MAMCGPRAGPKMRAAIATALRWPLSPKAMKMPAMISAAKNSSRPTPAAASLPSPPG